MMAVPKAPLPWRRSVASAFIMLLLLAAIGLTQADLGRLLANADQFFVILQQMSHPEWHFAQDVWAPMLETLRMAIAGTLFGGIIALPLALLCARNLQESRIAGFIARSGLNIIRTVPDLLLAALFVAVVGIGPMSGIITLAIFTLGMVGKLFYEAIEGIDPQPAEAIIAAGGGKLACIRQAVLPQVAPAFVSDLLYAFEINVRASTVLGYLGAGGIGVDLQQQLALFRYDRVAVMILVIFAAVVAIDYFSNQLRRDLL